MTLPIEIEIEVSAPSTADVEFETPSIDISPSPDGAPIVVVPSPGEPGPPGQDGAELTPEDFEELVADVEEHVLDNLEPPVDLVVWFENGLV